MKTENTINSFTPATSASKPRCFLKQLSKISVYLEQWPTGSLEHYDNVGEGHIIRFLNVRSKIQRCQLPLGLGGKKWEETESLGYIDKVMLDCCGNLNRVHSAIASNHENGSRT